MAEPKPPAAPGAKTDAPRKKAKPAKAAGAARKPAAKPKKAAAPKGARPAKAPRAKAAPPAAAAVEPAIPRPSAPWDAALDLLERDALSVFVWLALLPEDTAELVKELGISLPGFRQEALGDVQRADLLADEIRARPELRDEVLGRLREDFREPPFSHLGIDARGAEELVALLHHPDAEPLAAWRLLGDPQPEVREVAARYLADLAKRHYGPGEGAARGAPKESPEERISALEAKLAEAKERAETLKREGEARLESARKKADEQKEKLQEWLKDARARESAAREELARAREAADAAAREAEKLRGALAAAKAEEGAKELHRALAAARDQEARATSLESRLERARERERELEAELERARSAAATAGGPPAPAQAAAGGDDLEEAPSTWLFPVFTDEFYRSLDGWDRRIQRAAFKQAALLAQDHRHPSLRALPLEGLPNYYRVRVATDVRLLYRRGDRQNTIEILSVIDREDLDRYIKQAKTR